MLELKNYILKFDNKTVFKDTVFKAPYNLLTLITGESGVGKTTCLNSLMLDNEYDGEYIYQSKKVTQQMVQECFYHIEQFPIFINDLDIESHFLMIEEDFKELDYYHTLDKLKIEHLLNKYPNQLSDGEKKRVALSLALYTDREVLIIDEPTSSLNEEFSKTVCEILKEYAKNGHTVIASSHDSMLSEYADVIYRIEYNQFNCIRNSEDRNTETYISNKKQVRIKINDYFKMYRHHLKTHLSVKIMIILLVTAVGIGFVFNNEAIRLNINAVNEISSTEILVFKSVDGKGLADYSYEGREFPLNNEEVEALKNIEHISYANYRYDISIYNDVDENAKLQGFDMENILKKISAKQNNKELSIDYPGDFGSYMITMQTFDPRFDYGDKIKEKISDEKGIYLSKSLFNVLFKNADGNEALSLYFPVQVPVYNVSGIGWMQPEEGSEEYECNCVGAKEVWVELPVIGILSGNSLYDNYDRMVTSYNIFLDQDILEEYIEQYKQTENHTRYYTGEVGSSKVYNDELPPENEEIRQTIKAEPWTINCYIVRIDNLSYLNDVLTEINKIGLDAKSIYINATSLKSAVSSMQTTSRFMVTGIAVLLLFMGYSTKNKETNEKDMNHYLNNMGVKKKEILMIKIKKYFMSFVIQTIISLLIAFIILTFLDIIHFSATKFSITLVLIIVGVTFIIEFMFSVILERKWLKNVRTS